jgi:hypothetical protein
MTNRSIMFRGKKWNMIPSVTGRDRASPFHCPVNVWIKPVETPSAL